MGIALGAGDVGCAGGAVRDLDPVGVAPLPYVCRGGLPRGNVRRDARVAESA